MSTPEARLHGLQVARLEHGIQINGLLAFGPDVRRLGLAVLAIAMTLSHSGSFASLHLIAAASLHDVSVVEIVPVLIGLEGRDQVVEGLDLQLLAEVEGDLGAPAPLVLESLDECIRLRVVTHCSLRSLQDASAAPRQMIRSGLIGFRCEGPFRHLHLVKMPCSPTVMRWM